MKCKVRAPVRDRVRLRDAQTGVDAIGDRKASRFWRQANTLFRRVEYLLFHHRHTRSGLSIPVEAYARERAVAVPAAIKAQPPARFVQSLALAVESIPLTRAAPNAYMESVAATTSVNVAMRMMA